MRFDTFVFFTIVNSIKNNPHSIPNLKDANIRVINEIEPQLYPLE